MARKPNIPCAGCGNLMWGGSNGLPAGQAMCRPCRAALPITNHGAAGYNRGCRCDVCREAQRVRCQIHWRKKTGYDPTRTCRVCSAVFAGELSWQTCSPECSASLLRQRQSDRRARVRLAFVETVDPRAIFERDAWRCHICRRRLRPDRRHPHPRSATLDHVVPLSLGGSHEPANVQTACLQCNSAKGNRGGNEQLLLIG